jgi:hypothetical protein
MFPIRTAYIDPPWRSPGRTQYVFPGSLHQKVEDCGRTILLRFSLILGRRHEASELSISYGGGVSTKGAEHYFMDRGFPVLWISLVKVVTHGEWAAGQLHVIVPNTGIGTGALASWGARAPSWTVLSEARPRRCSTTGHVLSSFYGLPVIAVGGGC